MRAEAKVVAVAKMPAEAKEGKGPSEDPPEKPSPEDLSESKLPKRTRKYQSHCFESSHWDEYKPRDGDIIICSSYKAGTTWVQALVYNLLFPKPLKGLAQLNEISLWVDLRVPPADWKVGYSFVHIACM